MDSASIELRYETPASLPPEITFQYFPDGGVTITIPFRKKLGKKGKGNWSGLIAILLILYFLESPALFLTIRHHEWHTVAFITLLPIVFPAMLAAALFFIPRTPDFVEVIAASPDIVYIKLTNSKPKSFPRRDFKHLELRKPSHDTWGTTPRHISVWFHQHGTQMACLDRTLEETQMVADALQKAIDATAPSPPNRSSPTS